MVSVMKMPTIYHLLKQEFDEFVFDLKPNLCISATVLCTTWKAGYTMVSSAQDDLCTSLFYSLRAMYRNATRKLIWVGSDAWASRESVVYGREEVVEGAIAIQPLR
jgi:hypothetical protein